MRYLEESTTTDPRSRRRVPLGMIPARRRGANLIAAEHAGRRHLFTWSGQDGDLAVRPTGADPARPSACEVWQMPATITGPRLPVLLGEASCIGREKI